MKTLLILWAALDLIVTGVVLFNLWVITGDEQE
jgi:hypothetical protein